MHPSITANQLRLDQDAERYESAEWGRYPDPFLFHVAR